MRKTRIVGLNIEQMKKEMMATAVNAQTSLLVEYAEKEIKKIGDMIQTYNSKNHMDRSGNLLNSLCWIVTYGKDVKESGFYREAITRKSSYLHEFFSAIDNPEYVDGRALAETFIQRFGGISGKWTVAFAILAPYWGYWEGGFTMKLTDGSTRHLQHQVMTHIFDDVRMDLKPDKVHLTVYRPKYSYKNPKYKNKVGYRKIGLLR